VLEVEDSVQVASAHLLEGDLSEDPRLGEASLVVLLAYVLLAYVEDALPAYRINLYREVR
jgi:hypothetical protein